MIICQLAGVAGSVFTAPEITTWYSGLIKPSFNPPSWIFGPVWSILFLLMGATASNHEKQTSTSLYPCCLPPLYSLKPQNALRTGWIWDEWLSTRYNQNYTTELTLLERSAPRFKSVLKMLTISQLLPAARINIMTRRVNEFFHESIALCSWKHSQWYTRAPSLLYQASSEHK